MTNEEVLAPYFKPEARSSGARMLAQEKVFLSGASDLAVRAVVRSSPPTRVELSTLDMESKNIIAQCNCAKGKGSELCKHVWATILCAVDKYADFFFWLLSIAAKEEDVPAQAEPKPGPVNAYQEAAKGRAAEYRKSQRERQKAWGKKSSPVKASKYPADVEASLAYFALNGFPMAEGISDEELGQAKRQLSRVFHSDRGGTHEEIVELNSHAETLALYLRG